MSESYQFQRPAPPAPDPADEEPEYNPHARLDYLNTVNPHKKKRLWLRILITLLILLLLAGAGAFAYLKFFKKAATPAPAQSTTHTKTVTKPAEEKIATKHFDSTNFNLGFDYPETWTVTDNAETGRLVATSPAVSQKTSSGQTELVRTVMTIAAKGQNLTAFDKGSGLAVRNSEKIKYTNPTSVQRAETYLSFVQYSSTATGGGMDALYITGDYGYQKGQAIPKTDMSGLDPLIAITFEHCNDSTCSTTPTSANLPSSVWDDKAFSAPLLTLLTSIAVN